MDPGFDLTVGKTFYRVTRDRIDDRDVLVVGALLFRSEVRHDYSVKDDKVRQHGGQFLGVSKGPEVHGDVRVIARERFPTNCRCQCLRSRNPHAGEFKRPKSNERNSYGRCRLVRQGCIRGELRRSTFHDCSGESCSEQTKRDETNGKSDSEAPHNYLLSRPTVSASSDVGVRLRVVNLVGSVL
jgi:hypothetical protein